MSKHLSRIFMSGGQFLDVTDSPLDVAAQVAISDSNNGVFAATRSDGVVCQVAAAHVVYIADVG